MRKRVFAIIIVLCLAMTAVPMTAFADVTDVSDTNELLIFYPWHLNRTEEDGKTFTIRVAEPNKEIYDVEYGTVFILAEKVVSDGRTIYRTVDDVTCDDKGVKVETYRSHYQDQEDYHTITYRSVFTDELGIYTLKVNGRKIKINVTLPRIGFYTKKEATFENLVKNRSFDYVDGAKNEMFSITTGYIITDNYGAVDYRTEWTPQEESDGWSIEKIDEHTAKITIDKYVSHIKMHVHQYMLHDRSYSSEGFYITIRNKIADEINNTKIKASCKATKTSSGKTGIKLSWKKSSTYGVDKYVIYRSSKKSSGYSKIYTTKSGKKTTAVITKGLKQGKKYYFKIRGIREIDGKKYYTKWSNVSSIKI